MSEYWKSQPRKFCEFCKCWLADNKPSIQAHEFGKRHQDNVAAKIAAVQKKGQKDFDTQKKLESDFKKMEKAAEAAYEKDLERLNAENARKEYEKGEALRKALFQEMTEMGSSQKESEPIPSQSSSSSQGTSSSASANPAPAAKTTEWFEAKSPEGYSYYWHEKTNETVWVAPPEGFVSLEEQNKMNEAYETASKETDEKDSDSGSSDDGSESISEDDVEKKATEEPSVEEEKPSTLVKMTLGPGAVVSPAFDASKPTPKPVASRVMPGASSAGGGYGSWQAVEPPKEKVDLQLPKIDAPVLQVPTLHRPAAIKFREKTAAPSQGSALEAFKKRKLDVEKRKYIKRPTDDD